MLDNTQIPNSIINPNSTAFKDTVSPYPYLTFVTFFSQANTVNVTVLYNKYIAEWEKIKTINNTPETHINLVKSKYFELLQSINLKYVDEDEKRFLSNLDLTNPVDIDLLLPFYIDKINEITNYFIKKREDLKFAIQKNIGSISKQGISTQLKNFIIDDLLHNPIYEHLSDYTLDTITQNLEIDIFEKYDTFSHYHDIDPDTTATQYNVKNALFKKYFYNNVLNYNKIAFINENEYLLQAIKEYPLYIKEFGFSFSSIDSTTNVSSFKPKDFIDQQISSNIDDLNISTYKQLAQQYAGVDMYYISANTDTYTIDQLFSATNSSSNILSKKHTSIINIPSENLTTKRLAGGFFIPINQGISFYNTFNKEYIIKENIAPGICYFPDPKICGNIYGTSLTQLNNYPYIWKTNLQNLFYEKAYQSIAGELTSNYQAFYGYLANNHKCTLNNNFESITNNGYIYSYKFDTYGNEYATFKQSVSAVPATIQSLPEDSDINHSVEHVDVFGFNPNDHEYINFNRQNNTGWFTVLDGGVIIPDEIDGVELYKENIITTDYKEWPNYDSGNYFYDILIDASTVGYDILAIHDKHTKYAGFPIRAYSKQISTITTNTSTITTIIPATLYKPGFLDRTTTDNILSSCNLYDGNCWSQKVSNTTYNYNSNVFNDPDNKPSVNISSDSNIPYVSTRVPESSTQLSNIITTNIISPSIYEKTKQSGDVYIRYNNTTHPQKLVDVIDFIPSNITKLQNVDVIQDVMIITHQDGLTFIKIHINNDGKIVKSSTPIREFTNSVVSYNNIKNEKAIDEIIYSKYYYIEKSNSIIFAKLTKALNARVDDNDSRQSYDIVYPTIYMLYLDDLHMDTLFKPVGWKLLDFVIGDHNILLEDQSKLLKNILYIEPPVITYNSLNNLFSLTYIMHDLLNYAHVINTTFACQLHTADILSNDIYSPTYNTHIYTSYTNESTSSIVDIKAAEEFVELTKPIKLPTITIEKNGYLLSIINSSTLQPSKISWYKNNEYMGNGVNASIDSPGAYFCVYEENIGGYKTRIASNTIHIS